MLALLGQSGERLMLDLLMDCSVFVAVQAGFGNYYQLSGTEAVSVTKVPKLIKTRRPIV